MKQLFIAAVLLAAAASGADAQCAKDKTHGAEPAARETSNPVKIFVKINDAPSDAALPPDEVEDGGQRAVGGLTPEPSPSPPGEGTAAPDGEVGGVPDPVAAGGASQVPDAPDAAKGFRWRAAVEQTMHDIKDVQGCEAQFRAAFLLGCVGAWSLHPVQIEIAKKVFSPDPDEVKFAKKVIEAIPDGRGVHMIDGKMQDDATWKQCKVMVELAEMLAKKDPELAEAYELS